MFNVQVTGVEKIHAFMARLGRAFTDKEQEMAFKQGLKITQRQMVSDLQKHKKSGDLARSIRIEKDRKLSRTGSPVMRVGRRLKRYDYFGQGWAAHLLEHGTKPHTITSKTGKALPIIRGGTLQGFAKQIEHPGSRAFHTFSNAISRSEAAAIAATEQQLMMIIDREVRR